MTRLEDRPWETGTRELVDALGRSVGVLDAAGIDHLVIGGIASSIHGRPRWTHDIDVFVRPEQACDAVDALSADGMATELTDRSWLFKAFHGSVLIDIIFTSYRDIYLDDEMLARAHRTEFRGVPLRVISPEDLLIIKAVVHAEHSPRHWHDALALIRGDGMDWDYVVRRARHGPRRVLSLLLYAQSNDLPVPRAAVEALWDQVRDC